MAIVRANDFDVLDGSKVKIPRIGVWHAELVVDTPDAISGEVRIAIDGGDTYVGTPDRSGAYAERASLRVVGGAGGLRNLATPRHYTDTSLRIVLGDLLDTGGETLSATAEAAVLDRSLDHWTTLAIPIGRVITRLMATAAPDAAWRVLPDGTVWVGIETWPDSGLTTPEDYTLLDQRDDQDRVVLGVEVPRLRPGTTLAGKRVSFVEYRLEEGGVRVKAWFGEDGGDRFKAALAGAVKAAVPDLEYRAWYDAQIDAQEGSTVDVTPDGDLAELLPSMARIPLVLGAPGLTSDGASGGRVHVGWLGGDPSKPRAFAFDPDATAGEIVWNIRNGFYPGGKTGAQKALMAESYRTAEEAMHNAMKAALSSLVGASTGPLAGLLSGFTALTAAITAFEAAKAGYLATIVRVK